MVSVNGIAYLNYIHPRAVHASNAVCEARFQPSLEARSPHRGEGRGEEPQGTGGNSFGVQRSMFDVRRSMFPGSGRGGA
jgi:hypothetical protein